MTIQEEEQERENERRANLDRDRYDLTNIVKQAIVVRRDLEMRKGKIGAQASHASQEFIWQQGSVYTDFGPVFKMTLTDEQVRWRATGHRKVVLGVSDEAELFAIRDAALAAGLTVHVICDEGLTQIAAGSYTCLAIGPHFSNLIDPITQHLRLL